MDATIPVAGTAVLLRDCADRLEILLTRRPERGSFAAAWVFPGGIVEPVDVFPGEIEQQTAARAAIRECEEEVGVRPADLIALSCWMPPAEAPKRVRTWFFLATAPSGELTLSPDEVEESRWLAPAEALRLHTAGELRLFPPTWVTLHALARLTGAEDALSDASVPEFYATHIVGDGVFVWGGDAEHPEGGEGRHRLETATRPWQYLRD